jgi:hypothetical protein
VWILVAVLGFIAIGGLVTGPQLIADPTGAVIGARVSWLEATPIHDWFLVGWFLVVFMGVVPAVIAIGLLTRFPWRFAERVDPSSREHWTWTGTQVMGWGLGLWIALQLALIEPSGGPQGLFLGLGVALAALPWAPSVRRYLETQP